MLHIVTDVSFTSEAVVSTNFSSSIRINTESDKKKDKKIKDNKQIHTVHWAKPVSLNRDAISCPLLYSLKCMEIASLSYSLPCYFPALIQNGTWMSSDCAGSVIYVCHMWEEKLRYHLTPCCRGPGFLPVSP